MCAAAAWWRETGRLELFAAFPSRPGLAERGTSDGVGNAYVESAARGELRIFRWSRNPRWRLHSPRRRSAGRL